MPAVPNSPESASFATILATVVPFNEFSGTETWEKRKND